MLSTSPLPSFDSLEPECSKKREQPSTYRLVHCSAQNSAGQRSLSGKKLLKSGSY